MATGISINIRTGEETEVTGEPAVTPLASFQQKAKSKRDPELEYADHQQNILLDAGQPPSAAWSAYRIALRDITKDVAWATDPIAVVGAIIATRPV